MVIAIFKAISLNNFQSLFFVEICAAKTSL